MAPAEAPGLTPLPWKTISACPRRTNQGAGAERSWRAKSTLGSEPGIPTGRNTSPWSLPSASGMPCGTCAQSPRVACRSSLGQSFADAVVAKVKVDHPCAAPKKIRDDAQVGAIKVKPGKIVRYGEVSFASDDDEVLVESRGGRRERAAGRLVIAIPVGDADGQPGKSNAAGIAAKRASWVVSGELGEAGVQLGPTVVEKHDVLMTQNDEIDPALREGTRYTR